MSAGLTPAPPGHSAPPAVCWFPRHYTSVRCAEDVAAVPQRFASFHRPEVVDAAPAARGDRHMTRRHWPLPAPFASQTLRRGALP